MSGERQSVTDRHQNYVRSIGLKGSVLYSDIGACTGLSVCLDDNRCFRESCTQSLDIGAHLTLIYATLAVLIAEPDLVVGRDTNQNVLWGIWWWWLIIL